MGGPITRGSRGYLVSGDDAIEPSPSSEVIESPVSSASLQFSAQFFFLLLALSPLFLPIHV